jgi:YD repeat-containing protein
LLAAGPAIRLALSLPGQHGKVRRDGCRKGPVSLISCDRYHGGSHVLDGFGRPTSATNAKQEVTQLTWDADHNVIRLQENNAAVTTWTFDPNSVDPNSGYPLTMKDAQANADGTAAMTFGYQTSLSGHVADLTSKTSPEGRKGPSGTTPPATSPS